MAFRAIQKAMVEWGMNRMPELVAAVIDEAPEGGTRQLAMFSGQDATTTLKGSIRGRVRGRKDTVRIEVTSSVSYAIIIRDGRGEVVPKKAKVLHWVDADGNDVFAMRSGPVDPNPYPARGYARVAGVLKADLSHRLAEAALQELVQTARAGGMHL